MPELQTRVGNQPNFDFTKRTHDQTILMFGKQDIGDGLEPTFYIVRDGDGVILAVYEDDYCPHAPVVCDLQRVSP